MIYNLASDLTSRCIHVCENGLATGNFVGTRILAFGRIGLTRTLTRGATPYVNITFNLHIDEFSHQFLRHPVDRNVLARCERACPQYIYYILDHSGPGDRWFLTQLGDKKRGIRHHRKEPLSGAVEIDRSLWKWKSYVNPTVVTGFHTWSLHIIYNRIELHILLSRDVRRLNWPEIDVPEFQQQGKPPANLSSVQPSRSNQLIQQSTWRFMSHDGEQWNQIIVK